MSDVSFEQLLDESIKTIHNGEIVEGTVIDVKDDMVILNIGYKADGLLTKQEYSNDPAVKLSEEVKVGDTLEVKVLKVNDGEGQVLLSYKRLAAERGNKILEAAFENKEILTAPVTQVLNGGLSVTCEGTRVFIPASLVSDVFERDLKKYMDKVIPFVLIEFNPRKRRIIGDRRQVVEAEKAALQEALFARIQEGDVVEGTVKNVTSFGAFVDLGGADGLLHISEMSWGRVDDPRQVVKVGQPVTVRIKEINGKKIALSLKFEDQNPWNTAAERYAIGNVVEGRVARMTDFGAFVELEPGIDALLHVSQISRDRVEKPSDVLEVGQVVTVKVVDFNPESRKISLSMKKVDNARPAEEAEEYFEEAEEAVEEAAEEAVEAAEEAVEEVKEEAAEAVEEAVEAVKEAVEE